MCNSFAAQHSMHASPRKACGRQDFEWAAPHVVLFLAALDKQAACEGHGIARDRPFTFGTPRDYQHELSCAHCKQDVAGVRADRKRAAPRPRQPVHRALCVSQTLQSRTLAQVV